MSGVVVDWAFTSGGVDVRARLFVNHRNVNVYPEIRPNVLTTQTYLQPGALYNGQGRSQDFWKVFEARGGRSGSGMLPGSISFTELHVRIRHLTSDTDKAAQPRKARSRCSSHFNMEGKEKECFLLLDVTLSPDHFGYRSCCRRLVHCTV